MTEAEKLALGRSKYLLLTFFLAIRDPPFLLVQAVSTCIYGPYVSVHSAADTPWAQTCWLLPHSLRPAVFIRWQLILARWHFVKEYMLLELKIPGKKLHKIDHMYTPMKAFYCIFWNWEVGFTAVNLKPYHLQYHSHYAGCIWQVYII